MVLGDHVFKPDEGELSDTEIEFLFYRAKYIDYKLGICKACGQEGISIIDPIQHECKELVTLVKADIKLGRGIENNKLIDKINERLTIRANGVAYNNVQDWSLYIPEEDESCRDEMLEDTLSGIDDLIETLIKIKQDIIEVHKPEFIPVFWKCHDCESGGNIEDDGKKHSKRLAHKVTFEKEEKP